MDHIEFFRNGGKTSGHAAPPSNHPGIRADRDRLAPNDLG